MINVKPKSNITVFQIENLFLEALTYYQIFYIDKKKLNFYKNKDVLKHFNILFNIFILETFRHSFSKLFLNEFFIENRKKILIGLNNLFFNLQKRTFLKANTKTKKDLKYSTKKIYKQKGTGRARAGSRKNPVWRGGATIFGPKSRHINKKINRREKKLILNRLFLEKMQNIIILPFGKLKILLLNNIFNKTKIINNIFVSKKKLLFILPYGLEKCNDKHYFNLLHQYTKNIPNIKVVSLPSLKIKDILYSEKIMVLDMYLLELFAFFSNIKLKNFDPLSGKEIN